MCLEGRRYPGISRGGGVLTCLRREGSYGPSRGEVFRRGVLMGIH